MKTLKLMSMDSTQIPLDHHLQSVRHRQEKLPNHRQHQQTRDVPPHINEQSSVPANPRLGENNASSAFRKVSHQNLNAEGRRGSVGRPENNVGELVDYPSRPSHPGQVSHEQTVHIYSVVFN